ncbi:hypothetical protein DL767_009307 [Monosporascus sp. MG133]|nr:hypothetical protein DL767_009307 [Monosporascus sp. MG133]
MTITEPGWQPAVYPCPKVCVNNCERKADCDPGGYGEDYVLKSTCPLNVCCSKYGFCGTTSLFCGNKKVDRPSCAVKKSSRFKRVVGYYESWSTDRACNRFYPEQIPRGIYSHINFAFASINPRTFELVPAAEKDIDLYKRVASLKNKDANLKVLIAVGGWTFNDPGPTATTFFDIARDEAAQKKFIGSVLKFLQTYNFDGIDLDWEYPEADDRSGRREDFANFPKFMKNLKQALKNYEVSITLPASYWYLQHFDLKNLAPHVDFFNMMTYDFHGVWDKPNTSVGPILNSHTNLTEIKDGLDLLWRNNIDHDKVTLGLAFYGRGFMASSSACLEPGCRFESGTAAQACSAEVGVLLNSEIDGLVAEQNLKPVLNKDAAVKILTWGGNNWLTYDDEETLQMKADFARSECLGGVMVWAISHDTKDAKYSLALSRVAPRLFTALADETIENGIVKEETTHLQCRWTNCDENCPGDWVRMMRKDGGARGDEFMVNGAGCDGRGSHKLCCPPNTRVPECGWYSHNNGNCDNGSSCPAGTKEIGSNHEYCHTTSPFSPISSFQAACCTTETDNMALYSQCDWSGHYSSGSWPSCDKATCGADVVAFSGDGSGDATCLGGWYRGGMEDAKKNKYCCNQPEADRKWTNCEWQGMTDWENADGGLKFCTPTCSSGLVLVAMEHAGCSGGGAKARCCKANYKTYSTRYENSEDDQFKVAISTFVQSPVCSSNIFVGNPVQKRIDSSTSDWESTVAGNGTLTRRQRGGDLASFLTETLVERMVEELFIGKPRVSTQAIWNDTVVPRFNRLSYASLYEYQMGTGYETYLMYGTTQWPRYITCNLPVLQAIISGDGDDDGGSGSCTASCAEDRGSNLQKRAARDYDWWAVDPTSSNKMYLPWEAPDYPSPSNYDTVRERYKFAEAYTYDPACANFDPITTDILANGQILQGFDNDHFFERQMFPLWGDDALVGRLAAEIGDAHHRVPYDFFTVSLQQRDASGLTIQQRMMHALGSNSNRDVMTLLVKDMNLIKEKLWSMREELVSPREMENLTYGPCPHEALVKVRNVLSVYRWHQKTKPHDRLKTITNKIRELLREAERHYERTHGGQSPYALEHFDAWFQTVLETIKDRVSDFGKQWLANLNIPPITTNARDMSIRQNLVNAYNTLPDISTKDFFPPLP